MASATNEASTTNETSAATAAGDPERGAVKVSHNSDSSADPPKTRALLSWSSGKDSAWALHVLRRDPTVEVVGLLTTLNGAHDRIAMHGVRRSLLRAQARAVGLPLWERDLPDPCSNEDYARIMGAVVAEMAAAGVTAIAFGDLFLEDVRAYRERALQGTGVAPRFPLWGQPTAALAREMIDAGARAIVCCLDPRACPASLLGARFDHALLDALPPGVDPCAERGEFHTFATDGPAFRHPLAVRRGPAVIRDGFHFLDLELADVALTA